MSVMIATPAYKPFKLFPCYKSINGVHFYPLLWMPSTETDKEILSRIDADTEWDDYLFQLEQEQRNASVGTKRRWMLYEQLGGNDRDK